MVTAIGVLILVLGLIAWLGQTLAFLSRVVLKRAGKQVGSPASERAAYLFGSLWALAAFTMIGLAAVHLSG